MQHPGTVRRVTSPRLRDLSGLGAYTPGRRPAPGQQVCRLASNEMPFPLHPHIIQAVAKAVAEANRYPDPAAGRLVAALAARHGVEPSQVAVGCGSVQLVQELVQITCDAGDEVLYGWRSFEAYPTLTTVAGAVSVQVPLRDHRLDLPAMAAVVTDRTRLVLLCSPNNPTGPVLTAIEVEVFLAAVPPTVLVVLDEAYVEFVDDPAAVDGMRLLAAHPNLLVLRTFSKAYGLAGLRVGFALASTPEVAARLRQVHLPFAVSLAAQAAALASLEVEVELLVQVAAVVAEREPLRQALVGQGFVVPPAQGNFVWVAAGPDAVLLGQVLDEHGVLTRIFPGDGVRITVATAADSARVLAATGAFAATRS